MTRNWSTGSACASAANGSAGAVLAVQTATITNSFTALPPILLRRCRFGVYTVAARRIPYHPSSYESRATRKK
jgi:hypothetical protein